MDARRSISALLSALAAAGALAACGGDDSKAGAPLSWLEEPTIIVPSTLKHDRILRADVHNDSDHALRVEARAIKVYDDRGRRLKASATFAVGYLHQLYPPTRGPAGGLPDSELERIGRLAKIEPGKSAEVTVSWHEPGGKRTAARIDYGKGSLAIPPHGGKGAEGKQF